MQLLDAVMRITRQLVQTPRDKRVGKVNIDVAGPRDLGLGDGGMSL